MLTYYYLNGSWVEKEDFTLSAFDLAVTRGFGVFESLRTYHNQPFRIEDHLRRLQASANLLHITLPISSEEIKQFVNEGITKNNFAETSVRIIVTGGVSEDFSTPGASSLLIIFKLLTSPDPEIYTHGVKVITYPHLRFLPEAKSLHFMDAILAMQAARSAEAYEALYLDPQTAELMEGTSTNLFAVRENCLITPASGVLKGVTRMVVLELAQKLQIECKEGQISSNELNSYQELFLTGSSKQIVPIVQVNEVLISDGKVGEVAKTLKRAFEELVSA